MASRITWMAGPKQKAKNRKLYEQAIDKAGGNFGEALKLMTGFEEVSKSPTLSSVAKTYGISNFNSINDYIKFRDKFTGAAAAPAPAPPPPAPTPPPAPKPDAASQQYRQEAADYMAKADAMLNQFKIDQQNAEKARAAEQARMAEAQALQEKMRIQSQATLAANMARSGMQPNLQIAPASQAPQTAGTQAFKRRRNMRADMTSLAQGGLSALNIQQPSMLNV